MGWYLINEDERISIGRGRMVGRDDFADAPVLSRQHLKFVVTKHGLTVRDLGSRNGTWLNGEPVTSETPIPLRVGDVLMVKDYAFKIGWSRSHYQIGAVAVAAVLAMKMLDPTAGFGRAIGLVGWATFAASATLATVVVSLVLDRLVPAKFARAHLAAVIVGAIAVDLVVLLAVARHAPVLLDRIAGARIEYHCLTRFKPRQCIRQVEACPTCTIRIAKWRRDEIAKRIEAVNRGLASPGR